VSRIQAAKKCPVRILVKEFNHEGHEEKTDSLTEVTEKR
jgi:hypothetical protein